MATRPHPLLAFAATMLAFVFVRTAPSEAAPPASSLAKYKPTETEAVVHFEAGNRFFKGARIASRPLAERVRDLKRAIDEYAAGQALEDAPAFDYNIARAARLLVEHATAIAHLQRFLDRADQLDDEFRRAIEDEIAELDPSGEIRARFRPASSQVNAKSKPSPPDALRVSVPLEQASAAPGPALVPTAGSGATTTTAPSPAATTVTEPRGSRVWIPLGWGLSAAGVAGAGVTAWLGATAGEMDGSRRRSALIVGIGSGAVMIVGVVTLLIPSRAHAVRSGTAWNLGITRNSVTVLGRF